MREAWDSGHPMRSDPSFLVRLDRANQAMHEMVAERSGGLVVTVGDLVLVMGVHPSPVIANTAFVRANREDVASDPVGILAEILERFRAVGHGVGLLTADHADAALDAAAEAAEWELAGTFPGMVADRVDDPIPRPETTLRWVETEGDLARFRRVIQDGFAEDDEDVRGMVTAVFANQRSVAAPGVRAALVSAEGRDAAAATVYLHEGIAGIGWVATVPEFRKRGLGGLVTEAVTNAGFQGGADTAFLMASKMGEPVYRRLGFQTVTQYRIWFPPPRDQWFPSSDRGRSKSERGYPSFSCLG